MTEETDHLREIIESKLDKLTTINEFQSLDLSELKASIKEQKANCLIIHGKIGDIIQDHESRLNRIEASVNMGKWLVGVLLGLLAAIGAVYSGAWVNVK